MKKVLSLFDGKSGGMTALKQLGYSDFEYYAAEIDKYATAVSNYHYPEIIRLGDVCNVKGNELGRIDLILCGSPCQSFSNAGLKEGFNGKSKLFWEFVRILFEAREVNPKVKFLFENVYMKQEWQDIITEALNVNPVIINSNLVSAQNRKRLYWTNLPFCALPKDKNILLNDVLESEVDEKYYLTNHQLEYAISHGNKRGKSLTAAFNRDKARCLTARSPKRACHDSTLVQMKIKNATKKGYITAYPGDGISLEFPNSKTRRGRVSSGKCPTLQCSNTRGTLTNEGKLRVLTPLEFERLQTLPDNYTKFGKFEDGSIKLISDNQRYKIVGNGWTNEVIKFLLQGFTSN